MNYWLEMVNVRGKVYVSASYVGLSATRKFAVAVPELTFVPAANVTNEPAVVPDRFCQELLAVTPVPDADDEYWRFETPGAALFEVPAVRLVDADCTVILA